MKKTLLLLIFFTTITYSQNQVKAFKAGEKLNYTASYKMSGLMTDLAEVTMQTSEVKTSKSTLLKLKCVARTYSKWDNFFKIRDLYESYVNPNNLTPYLHQRDINEGSYYKFVKYNFNHKTNIAKSLIRKNMAIGGTYDVKKDVKINAGTKDLVTTIYHIRNLDINKASIGDTDTFNVIFDQKETKVALTYLAKETINTAIGKKECYKLAISVNDSNFLNGKNNNVIWLTADENKIPVYAKFKIAIGSGELRINSATGLKN